VNVEFQADGLLHTTCGSPNYMAPEVITYPGVYTTNPELIRVAIDIWVVKWLSR
jgi:5'-AMP-activated protein kinase catalytic alpha subunit